MVGHPITGIAFRRTAANEIYQGGAASLTVTLSHSPRVPPECSNLYADNVGADATQVFQGTVTIPTSPAVTGPTVPWSAANVIQIPFVQPFVYQGGTLCIDITGLKVQGQIADWWMADAAYDFATGTAVDIGPGCGPYANAQGQWSIVYPHSLLPGSRAHFEANGPEGNYAVAVIGAPGPAVDLSLVGLANPGCNAYLSSIEMMYVTPFVSLGDPLLAHRGGLAEWDLPVPNQSWVLGISMVAQWLDLFAQNASNGVLFTVASQPPTLDMALVDGVVNDVSGNVTPYLAHVLRFDYQ